ncbi:MAG: hypothetical protein HYU84_06005 [Chloroflexi bacterium]|nr:hypothetical protein [Chloroflexota bacterium]
MPNLEKAPELLDQAFAEWRKQETLKRGKTSIGKFAEFLGYSPAAVGFWLNRDRPISEEALITILPKLAELLGEEIYNKLDIPKPDKLFEYVSKNWDEAPIEERQRIAKIIQKYTNTPIPNDTRPKPSPKS